MSRVRILAKIENCCHKSYLLSTMTGIVEINQLKLLSYRNYWILDLFADIITVSKTSNKLFTKSYGYLTCLLNLHKVKMRQMRLKVLSQNPSGSKKAF